MTRGYVPNTLITTSRGFDLLKDLPERESLVFKNSTSNFQNRECWLLNDRKKHVAHKLTSKGIQDTLYVETSSGFHLEGGRDQTILALIQGKLIPVTLADLQENDVVCLDKNSLWENRTSHTSFDEEVYDSATLYDHHFLRSSKASLSDFLEDIYEDVGCHDKVDGETLTFSLDQGARFTALHLYLMSLGVLGEVNAEGLFLSKEATWRFFEASQDAFSMTEPLQKAFTNIPGTGPLVQKLASFLNEVPFPIQTCLWPHLDTSTYTCEELKLLTQYLSKEKVNPDLYQDHTFDVMAHDYLYETIKAIKPGMNTIFELEASESYIAQGFVVI